MAFERETYIQPKWLDTWSEKEKGPNGRCLCKRCGKEVQPPRRYWCGKECINELNRQSGSPRKLAYRRDKGVCKICGFDCDQLEGMLWYCWGNKSKIKWFDALRKKYPWAFDRSGHIRHTWEADHEKPVIEGGGEIGMDNIRTLCVPCHRVQTKKLHGRLSGKRAGRQSLPGMEIPL